MLHFNQATALHERHHRALSNMLRRMLQLKQCKEAWDLLLHVDPVDSARMLFCAEPHHISGKCQTKASANQLSIMPDIQLSALDNLAAINNPDALTVDTLWYYVPYRSYSSVSVGTVISENEDNTEFLTLDKAFRHTRYARDDSCGDFLTLHINIESNFVEAFYIMPKSITERERALIRFDYDLFITATNTIDVDIAVSGLLRAVSSSHLVQESRHCPFCSAIPGTCNCKLQFYPPKDPFDYAQNAKNMLDMVGDYVGISYHYLREKQFLGEFFNTCSLEGGIGSIDRAKRLLKCGMQHCLKNVPTTILSSPPILPLIENTTPPAGNNTRQDPICLNTLSLPHPVFPIDEASILGGATDSNVAVSEISDLSAIDSPPGLVPTIPTIAASNGFGVNMGIPQSKHLPALSQPLAPLSRPLFASPLISLPTPIVQPQQVVPINELPPKATAPVKKPRGRRPRPPPKRLTKLLRLAPAAITTPGLSPTNVASSLENSLYGEFATEDELKAHLRKLRSRESAAKSNERRRHKRILEEQQKKLRAEAEKQQLQQQQASSS